MSDYIKECDVAQGFNVSSDMNKAFGYINYLRIGHLVLTPDIHASVPVERNKAEHVGVISDLFWQDTARVQPITVDFRLSVANQQQLTQYTQKNNFNSDVLIEFEVYDYDPNAGAFYSSFNTDKETIEGNLEVLDEGKLSFYIEREAEKDIQSPVNHFVSFSMVPTSKTQQLINATSVSIKTVLPWG